MNFSNITLFALRILSNISDKTIVCVNYKVIPVQIIAFFVHDRKTCPHFTFVRYLESF